MSSERPKFLRRLKGTLLSRATNPRSSSEPRSQLDGLVKPGGLSGNGNSTPVSYGPTPASTSEDVSSALSIPVEQPPSESLGLTSTLSFSYPPGNDVDTLPKNDKPKRMAVTDNPPKHEPHKQLTETGATDECIAEKDNLWDQAYECLTKENPSLVAHYEQILSLEEAGGMKDCLDLQGPPGKVGNTHTHTRWTDLASKKLASLDQSRLTLGLGSKTAVLRDGVDKVLTIVITATDFVSSTVAAEPHAALAWAGVCLLLPVSLVCHRI